MSAIKNIKKGLLLSINDLFRLLGNWLVVLIAIEIMTSNSFKIFDLSLLVVSFIALFSSNLLISSLSVSDVEENPEKDKGLILFIVFGIIFSLIFFIIIDFIPLEFILYEFFNLYLSVEGKSIIRFLVLLIFSMIIVSFLAGKVHALGRYKEIFISSLLAFLGLLSFLILGYYFNNGTLLIVGLLIFNLIGITFYYFFIFKS